MYEHYAEDHILFNDARSISDEIASNGGGGARGPVRADIPFLRLEEMGNPTKASSPKSWASRKQSTIETDTLGMKAYWGCDAQLHLFLNFTNK